MKRNSVFKSGYFNGHQRGEIGATITSKQNIEKALQLLLHVSDSSDSFFKPQKKITMSNGNGPGNEYDENIVKEILNSETDLRLYSAEVEKALTELENDTIADYIKEADNITELHSQITSSDLILERLEGMLCAFQADLSNICQEILSLQELSASLNIRLKNKQAIRAEMSDFIEDIIIPEAVIKHIVDTPVSEKEFMEQLYILDHKISFVKVLFIFIFFLDSNSFCYLQEQSFREAKSCIDVMEILNNLKSKAILKIREYILKKIFSCRKPMTNFSIVQNALLKNKFFFKFLATHEREIAHEIIGEYTDTMGKVYYSYFKEYISKLSKLMYEDLPDKDDLLGNDESSKNKSTSIFSLKPAQTMKHRSNVFALGNRESLLNEDLESSLIVPHVAVKSDTKYSLESIFKSIQFAFLDNACREYLFISEFFIASPKRSLDFFNTIYHKTLDLLYKNIDEQFLRSYDAIGLFTCLHIVYRYRMTALKRNVTVLNSFWERIVKTIWPQFEKVFVMHIESIKLCDLSKMGAIDNRPHIITRRYAEFSAAIMIINDTFPDERVSNLLNILQVWLVCKQHFFMSYILFHYRMKLSISSYECQRSFPNPKTSLSSLSTITTLFLAYSWSARRRTQTKLRWFVSS